MSKIEELREKLYRRNGGEKKESREETGFAVLRRDEIRKSWESEKKPEDEISEEKMARRKRALKLFVFIGIMGFIVFAGFVVFSLLGLRTREADVSIFSKNEAEAGETITYRVLYRNKSKVALKNIELVFSYPPGSQPINDENLEGENLRSRRILDDLPANGSAEAVYQARVFGKEGEEKIAEAVLFYKPENLTARFSESAKFSTRIFRVPLSVSFDVIPEISSGQEVAIVLNYSSTAGNPFKNISLRADYPPGFKFISAEPAPKFENNIWEIGELKPQTSGKVTIKGNLSGAPGESKAFNGVLGIYNENTRVWEVLSEAAEETKIFVPPLSVEERVNGGRYYIASPGDRLYFSIHYKNNFSEPIKNVSISVELSGTALNFADLRIEKGFFDAVARKIIWSPGSFSELREIAAGQEGEFKFSIPVLDRPPVRSSADKNLVITSRAKIETKEPPRIIEGLNFSSEDSLEIKLNSKVLFSASALYYNSPIPTSGPLPPQVGKTTIYTIIWQVRNFSNDLNNFSVKAALPPNIHWVGKVSPSSEPLTFNEAASEIAWNIGNLPAGTGILNPSRQVAFQVSLTPAPSDVGGEMVLSGDASASGIDSFTNQTIGASARTITTRLSDDPLSQFKEWTVAP